MSAAAEETYLADLIPTDPVQRDAEIDAALERLAELEAEVEQNNQIAERRMDTIRLWRDAENERLSGNLDYWRMRINALVTGYDFGKKKSRNLPHGTFGTRQKGGGIEIIDADAALAFAKSKGIPLKESVGKTALKEWHESTGLVPDGCEVVPVVDEPYVKAVL